MAESAFGIDHGEIAKFSFGAGATKVAGGLRQMGSVLGQGVSAKAAKLKPMQGPQKPGMMGGMKRAGQTAQGAGQRGMSRLGAGMQNRPGLTGGIAAGGAGAGVMGSSYAAGAASNKNKRLSQYR